MHAYRDQYAQIFNGGRNVVLVAISTDSLGTLESWARDDDFPFLVASDADGAVGKLYGASVNRPGVVLDSRALFVVGPDGRIAHTMAPFREIDPTAYTELEEAIRRTLPAEPDEEDGS